MNWNKWNRELSQRRFIFLLGLLFLYLTLSPVFGTRPFIQLATAAVSAILFGQCCISIIGPRKRFLHIAVGLCFAAAIARSLALYDGDFDFVTIGFQIWTISFFAVMAVILVFGILRDVLAPGEIDGNRIAGAACAYVMIGIVFGNLFLVCSLLNVQSFNVNGTYLTDFSSMPVFDKYQLLYYYSFCTLTTLGYGDVIPSAGLTRALSFNEALLGQIYLAVFVARLIGMRMVSLRDTES